MHQRHYGTSSSFKMALLFTICLGIALILMAYMIVINIDLMRTHPTLLISFGVCMLLMLVVIGVSYFISYFVVSKINYMSQVAQKMMATGDLSERIIVNGGWDDLSHLCLILNELFSKVDALMEGIREVSDNIAHDLAKPLARVRNELADIQKDAPDAHKAKVDTALTDLDNLIATFKAILRISNIEKGKTQTEFETLNAHELLNDVIALYEPLLNDKGITLTTNIDDATIMADKHLLFQALANLLDNALKFTPKGGSVKIDTQTQQGRLQINVSDTGKGIPHAAREKVFKRFYREDASRTHDGNGLGLAMVKAVVKLHRGNISIGDNLPCGCKMTLSLPQS